MILLACVQQALPHMLSLTTSKEDGCGAHSKAHAGFELLELVERHEGDRHVRRNPAPHG